MELFIQSIKDLFTSKMLKYSLVPLIATLIVSYIAFGIVASMGIEHLQATIQSSTTTIQNGVPHTQSDVINIDTNQTSGIAHFIATYLLGSWIFSFFVYVIGGFFVLYASIFVAVIIIGFLTPFILKELQRLHYKGVVMIGFGNMAESILFAIKWAFFMLGMFLLFLPLYFIPIVNMIALNFPLYYFFHKMINYDIASNILTKEEFAIIKSRYANELRLKSLLLYILSLIPSLILFASVLFVIYLGHTYFRKAKELRRS
jgi:hypothetical protein